MPPGGPTAGPVPLAGVVGPTASGKTELALALAERIGAEIVVADSRQVYRGMDIGTAKPTAEERRRVPHHLLDLVDPDQPFSVADWVRAAREAIAGMAARGRLPLLVGGTGLYVSALVGGYDFESVAAPPAELRERLLAELDAGGAEPLAQRLAGVAPEVAARTDLRNPRRVVRALERQAAGASSPAAAPWTGPLILLALNRPRAVLYRRIDDRAAALFEQGLVEEVRGLLAAGYRADLPPMSGHGYAEAARVVMGEWSVERAIEVTARRTRQYAKRQLTWFRADRRIIWLPTDDRPGDDPAVVEQAVAVIRAGLADLPELSGKIE